MAEVLRLARELGGGEMVTYRAAEAASEAHRERSSESDCCDSDCDECAAECENAAGVLAEVSTLQGQLSRAFDALGTYGGGIPAVSAVSP